MESCRLLDRGHSLIAFEGRGMATVSRQSGVPIVPVRINNSLDGWAPRFPRVPVTIEFLQPIFPDKTASDAELLTVLEEFYSTSRKILFSR
jgi:1-acyl-sn-glycerol-3-phosphate acyltransferase